MRKNKYATCMIHFKNKPILLRGPFTAEIKNKFRAQMDLPIEDHVYFNRNTTTGLAAAEMWNILHPDDLIPVDWDCGQ